jgi:hypothetical protein
VRPFRARLTQRATDTPHGLPATVPAAWHRQRERGAGARADEERAMSKTFDIVVRHCSTCRRDTMFEQPSCLDDHGKDCPELVCVECGDALLLGFAVPEARLSSRPRRSTVA